MRFGKNLQSIKKIEKSFEQFKQLIEKTLEQFRSKSQNEGMSKETELLIRRPRRGIGVTMISFLKPPHRNF